MKPITVVKVGGSLFNWSPLRRCLESFLGELDRTHIIVVPGGGPIVDVLRELDQRHGLGDEVSHWLALASLSLNARWLSQLLGGMPLIGHPSEVGSLGGKWMIDLEKFALMDELNGGHLPHSWIATSDAFAARVAEVADSRELILLKSAAPPTVSVEHWPDTGHVDAVFPEIVRRANLRVELINLRDYMA